MYIVLPHPCIMGLQKNVPKKSFQLFFYAYFMYFM